MHSPTTTSVDVSEHEGVRYLHFGSAWVQGAMRVKRPWALELDYTRDMMLSLLLRDATRWPRSVLLIGLGAASQTKFLYRHYPNARLTVIERDPRVVDAARQFFKLPDDRRRLIIEIADGDAYLAQCQCRFDLILVDGFDAAGRPGSLDTLPFYRRARTRLDRHGVIALNLLGGVRQCRASMKRLRSAFDERILVMPSGDVGNTIVFGATGAIIDIAWDSFEETVEAMRWATGLSLLPTLARLRRSTSVGNGRWRL